DFRVDLVFEIEVDAAADAACIDDREGGRALLALGMDAVAGDARLIVHDGDAPACEAIEQGAFSHIGAAYDGNGAFGHSLEFVLGLGITMSAGLKLSNAFDDVFDAGDGREKAREVNRYVEEFNRGLPGTDMDRPQRMVPLKHYEREGDHLESRGCF